MTEDRASPRVRAPMVALAAALLVAGIVLAGWLVLRGSGGPPELVSETPVTAMDLRARVAVTSPTVARDPTEPSFLAAATQGDAPGPGCALQVSGDGGESWVQLDAFEDFPEGIGACYQPQVAFGANGRLTFSFVGMAGPPPEPAGVFAVVSDDRGTFTQVRRIADLGTITPRLAASRAGIELVWVEPVQDAEWGRVGPPWPIGPRVQAASGDAGGLGDAVVVAEPETLVAAPTIAADPDGNSAVAYYELPPGADPDEGVASLAGSGPWRLMVAVRRADGTFADPVQVAELEWADQAVWDSDLRADEEAPGALQPLLFTRWGIAEPALAVQDGRVCVGWTDGRDDRLRALVSCSEGGVDWAAPQILLPRAEGRPVSWLPQVAISPSGRVQAAYHARDEADTEAVDVWFAQAREPGAEFSERVRLTSSPSSPRSSPRPGWFGSRIGLATGSDTAVALWADARNSSELQANQAVFAAMVRTPGSPPAAALLLAAGLMVVGLVGIVVGRRRGRVEPSGQEPNRPTERAGAGAR